MSETKCKDAIAKAKERLEKKLAEEGKTTPVDMTAEKEVLLYAMYPPICKMDSALVTLKACEKLSLSTNNIEKMGSLTGLENLKILSVGKNLIKKLDGVADVGEHLEELWCSYNLIEKLTNFEKLTKLRVLYMSNNKVADFKQLEALKDAPLEEILLTGNPLKQPSEAEADEIGSEYRVAVLKQLKSLVKIDGINVTGAEREAAAAEEEES